MTCNVFYILYTIEWSNTQLQAFKMSKTFPDIRPISQTTGEGTRKEEMGRKWDKRNAGLRSTFELLPPCLNTKNAAER